jgi:hypothetical protein
MKNFLHQWTFTQLTLLAFSLIVFAIGCENQGRAPVVLHPVDTVKVDTVGWVTEHSEIGKDGGR